MFFLFYFFFIGQYGPFGYLAQLDALKAAGKELKPLNRGWSRAQLEKAGWRTPPPLSKNNPRGDRSYSTGAVTKITSQFRTSHAGGVA